MCQYISMFCDDAFRQIKKRPGKCTSTYVCFTMTYFVERYGKEEMMKLKNNLLLVLAALIWGVAFVAQSVGMEYVGPFTFNAVRFLIGGLVLVPCIFFLDRRERKERGEKILEQREARRTLLLGGLCCGLCLTVASTLQQFGIMYTTVGKAGFITALYMIIVPVIGIFLGKKLALPVWVSVGLGVAGMYLLCITESFHINFGDLLVLLCSICFAGHILVIDYFSPRADGVKMSCIQFFICGIICAVPMLLLEHPSLTVILNAWQPILYTGILSCGVAYTLQIVAQKGTNPVAASLLLSLESVFSVLAGWLILGQRMSVREIFGCVLVFAGIILVQIPWMTRDVH